MALTPLLALRAGVTLMKNLRHIFEPVPTHWSSSLPGFLRSSDESSQQCFFRESLRTSSLGDAADKTAVSCTTSVQTLHDVGCTSDSIIGEGLHRRTAGVVVFRPPGVTASVNFARRMGLAASAVHQNNTTLFA